jgi:hypothetical protein
MPMPDPRIAWAMRAGGLLGLIATLMALGFLPIYFAAHCNDAFCTVGRSAAHIRGVAYVLVLGVVRSVIHVEAGQRLFAAAATARRYLGAYVGVAVVQVGTAIAWVDHVTPEIGALLLAWPACLVALQRRSSDELPPIPVARVV